MTTAGEDLIADRTLPALFGDKLPFATTGCTCPERATRQSYRGGDPSAPIFLYLARHGVT